MEGASVRIAFVDDHPVLLEALSAVFGKVSAFSVVALGCSAGEALRIAQENQPEILFVDLSMPGDAFAAIADIAEHHSETKVIVFTAFSSVDSAMRALEAGATGFVLKGATAGELFEAVDHVRRGEMFITQQYASQVMSGLRGRAQQEAVKRATNLNMRETQIVSHLLLGRTNREIASSLSISEKTVKNYMSKLMLKLHARNRVEVAIQARRNADLN